MKNGLIISKNGDKLWYLENIEYSEQEFNAIQLHKKLNLEVPGKQFNSKKHKI